MGASGPSGGGGDDAGGGGDDAAAAQGKLRAAAAAIPNYSGREEQVVRLSKRLLNVFYFCGTIFAGPSRAGIRKIVNWNFWIID